MRTFVKWTFSAASLVVCVGLIFAWCTMFQGKPWDYKPGQRKGVLKAEYGDEVRSLEVSLNGDGIRVERNPSAYSFMSNEPPPSAFRRSYVDRPNWNWCGTGQDSYQVSGEWTKAGFEWRRGAWHSSWGKPYVDETTRQVAYRLSPPRPHFALMVPHWLLVTMTALAPLTLITSLIRRCRRVREGCCRACGYDLTGNVSGICPECGTPCVSGVAHPA